MDNVQDWSDKHIDDQNEAQTNAMLDEIYEEVEEYEDEESCDAFDIYEAEEARYHSFNEDISLPQGFTFIELNG